MTCNPVRRACTVKTKIYRDAWRTTAQFYNCRYTHNHSHKDKFREGKHYLFLSLVCLLWYFALYSTFTSFSWIIILNWLSLCALRFCFCIKNIMAIFIIKFLFSLYIFYQHNQKCCKNTSLLQKQPRFR